MNFRDVTVYDFYNKLLPSVLPDVTRGHFGEHVGGANGLEEDILGALLEALADPVGHILRFMARYLKH